MQRQQVLISTDDHVRFPSQSNFQKHVMFGGAASCNRLGRRDPLAAQQNEADDGLDILASQAPFLANAGPVQNVNQFLQEWQSCARIAEPTTETAWRADEEQPLA